MTEFVSLIDELHAAPTADGIERVLLPGEREWNNVRRASQSGIELPLDVVEKLRLAANLTGVLPAWLSTSVVEKQFAAPDTAATRDDFRSTRNPPTNQESKS